MMQSWSFSGACTIALLNKEKTGAPDTIRTCDLCLRRANAHAPNPGRTHLINPKNGMLQAPGQPRPSVPPYSALRCETALWPFHDIDRRRKLKGRAKTWMSHHQIPRRNGDQAERCDGILPFASRLMALLSMTGHCGGTGFVEGEIPFCGVAQTGID